MTDSSRKFIKQLESKQESSFKPARNCILAFLAITLACYILSLQHVGIIQIISKIYFFPFQKIIFSKSIFLLIVGIAMTFVSFIIFALISEPKNKFHYYLSGIILAYFVYLSLWIFVKAISTAYSEMVSGEVIAIVNLLFSLVLLAVLFVLHLILTSSIYEECFIKKLAGHNEYTISVQERRAEEARKKKILERDRKISGKQSNGKITRSIKESTALNSSFKENKELAEKIKLQLEQFASNKTLTIDTNIMIKCPLLVKELSNRHKIILSKKVFEELDKKKTDKEIGANARMAMRVIEEIQLGGGAILIVSIDDDFLKDNGFNPNSPDDFIIGSYLKQKRKGENILFVSEDRGARITARSVNLDVLNF